LRALPYNSTYACSKAALVRLTDTLQQETASHGVMIFAASPGLVRTLMVETLGRSKVAQRWIPEYCPDHPNYAKLPWVTPNLIAARCVRLAQGDRAASAGRFMRVRDGFDVMRSRVDDIMRDDLYHLRLHTLPPN